MSLVDALHDPFANDFPTFLEVALPAPVARGYGAAEVGQCSAFSARGNYLAVGSSTASGRVVVLCLVTKSVVAAAQLHAAAVSSVQFLPRRGGRLLLSSSADGTVKVTDLLGMRVVFERRFGAGVAQARFSHGRCLVSLGAAAPLSSGAAAPGGAAATSGVATNSVAATSGDVAWPVLFELDLDALLAPAGEPGAGAAGAAGAPDAALGGCITLQWALQDKEAKAVHGGALVAAAFAPDGASCFVGGHGGEVHLFDARSGAWLRREAPLQHKRTGTGLCKRIVLSGNGRVMLMQLTDKVIHMLSVDVDGALSHIVDLQDSVDGTRWSALALSPDGEYAVGGSHSTHSLHIWNVLGRHMATLQPPVAGLARDIQWHPRRPLVSTLAKDGQIFLWATHRSEAWSAFAPSFVQLEDNIEYHEREDEFDRNPHADAHAPPASAAQDSPVDVVGNAHDDPVLAEFAFPLHL
jgi:WD40 repeat protein